MKKKNAYILTLVLCLSLFVNVSCKRQSVTTDAALKFIQSLAEVMEYSKALKKKGVKPFIRNDISNKEPDKIYFSVGESHETHTVNWNSFAVDKKTGEVFVLDIESGEFIPLQDWRSAQE